MTLEQMGDEIESVELPLIDPRYSFVNGIIPEDLTYVAALVDIEKRRDDGLCIIFAEPTPSYVIEKCKTKSVEEAKAFRTLIATNYARVIPQY